MEQKVCDTPITGQYVAEHMKKALGPEAILQSIDAKRIAAGQGLMSHILQANLIWEGKDEILPSTVIIKVPVVESLHKLTESLASGQDGEKMKAMMAQLLIMAHKAECDLYQMFGKKQPVAMPKFYVALPVTEEAPGMIILEDLSKKGSIPPSFIQGMTYPQVLAAVTEVARLHAWSLTTSVDWRSQIPKLEDREQLMRGFVSSLAGGFKMSKEQYPNEFGSIDIEQLTTLCTYEWFASIMNEHHEFMDDVLIHGDFHMNNILYEKKADGSVGDKLLALIDFQAVLRSTPAYDIGRLLAFSVSSKIRRGHYEDILRRYYDEVKKIAGDKFKASLDQIRKQTDRLFGLSALMSVASIPMLHHLSVKSEGEQKAKEEKQLLENIKENYDDGLKVFGI